MNTQKTKSSRLDTKNRVLTSQRLFFLALCAGLSVANLYYSQPLLADIARSFETDLNVGLVSTATQIGYALGIVILLPLGDLVDRRRLIMVLSLTLSMAMLLCSVVMSIDALIMSSFFVGFGAISGQILVPLAADLSHQEKRGHAIGTVFSGILSGILLARTVSGTVGEVFGWRAMFVFASFIALTLAVIVYFTLPVLQAKSQQKYSHLFMSMGTLLRQHSALRMACFTQALLFAVFSGFWSVLSLVLAEPPFEYGSAMAGAFGFIGAVGVLGANISGRFIDKIGARRVLLCGLLCCVIAYGVFAAQLSLVALIVGIIVLDFGLAIANVANQSTILTLDETARSRINTLYVTSIFTGGAIGSAVASFAWFHGGWGSVSVFGLFLSGSALLLHIRK
ncbi:MFS transporter [Marinomonas sp. IMCC 4694]|uniref:MFS transporter n=1 Tax=Marinomonas sp. IMCC 4694 TaxID=2605432 RepID=UPI0011E7B0C4|nr:MFS transporter [Marinomonas sp. IMCC 4694]TYL46970.1 MFS transporter [Marinomonas sp. IMCC 4694]